MDNPNFFEGRFSSHDGSYHYSREEIELFAMAIGVRADMVEIQRNGQLGLRRQEGKQIHVEVPASSQPQ